jgi:hypothetical protein
MISEQQYRETWVKSYRYVRTALISLLVCLAVAVVYQTAQQGWSFLASVSAYYYTPAQAIFVGSLIAVGVSMIALKGTDSREDLFLNLGGMFAVVVAIVPTARSADFRTAVRACKEADTPLLTERASPELDCPTVRALDDAARANIENNMVALLVVGALALLAALFFSRRESHRGSAVSGIFKGGLVAAFVVWLAALLIFSLNRDWFIAVAHYAAALGLLVCIVLVVLVNARRRHVVLRQPSTYDRYAVIALVMLPVLVIGIPVVIAGIIAVFWLEAIVALVFLWFWVVQTNEQLGDEPQPAKQPQPREAAHTISR